MTDNAKSHDAFFAEFDRITRNGQAAYAADYTSEKIVHHGRTVRAAVTADRNQWKTQFAALSAHYSMARCRTAEQYFPWDLDGIWSQRLVAPRFVGLKSSTLPKATKYRAEEARPATDRLEIWEDLAHCVQQYNPVAPQIPPNGAGRFPSPLNSFFELTLAQYSIHACEADERAFVQSWLGKLKAAGLIGDVDNGFLTQDRTDLNLTKTSDQEALSVIVKVKATHNLRLPLKAEEIFRILKEEGPEQTGGRGSNKWNAINSPLIQLCGSMHLTGCRFGALTSATKTWFVKVARDGNGIPRLWISDAWFVGMKNYLRAWAYVNSLGDLDGPTSWQDNSDDALFTILRSSRQNSVPRLHGSPQSGTSLATGQSGAATCGQVSGGLENRNVENMSNMERAAYAAANFGVPFIDQDDLVLQERLEYGNRRCCFRVRWGEQEAALKEYDFWKNERDDFEQESVAYMRLRELWAISVPTPLFVAYHKFGGVFFLGLSLGRSLRDDEANEVNDKAAKALLSMIEDDYGIRLCDPWSNDFVMFPQSDGSEKIAVIDLDDWEDVPRQSASVSRTGKDQPKLNGRARKLRITGATKILMSNGMCHADVTA